MPNNFFFLKLFGALLLGITKAFQPVTKNNHVLVGHVLQQFYARDWFNCSQACHDEPKCISYNYKRSTGANGLCELNHCGLDGMCERDKSLIYSTGFVFQQIRKEEVSFTIQIDSILLIQQNTTCYIMFVKQLLEVFICKRLRNISWNKNISNTSNCFTNMWYHRWYKTVWHVLLGSVLSVWPLLSGEIYLSIPFVVYAWPLLFLRTIL